MTFSFPEHVAVHATGTVVDVAGQLSSLANLTSGGSVLSSFEYTVDPTGNRVGVIEASGDRTTWSYDATYQLTREHRTEATAFCITHVYDTAGNRLQEVANGSRKTFTYDAANQLATSDDSTGRTTYTYDASGNLAIQASLVGRTTNTWDAENRLLLVQAPAGVINTMTYDADGLRTLKEDTSGTTEFVWDGQNVLLETDASDNVQAAYTLSPHVYGKLVSQRRGGVSRFCHVDGLDSVVGLSDNTPQIVDTYVYEAYGQIAAMSGSSVNPFRFVGALGYYFDADSATYYIRARHYNPTLACWLSRDPRGSVFPVLGEYEDSVGLYDYVHGRPVITVDPSGLQGSQSDSCACCKKAVAKAPARIAREKNTCYISYECREGRNSCQGRWGYTSEPVKRPGTGGVYDISICLACGYDQTETQANLDREVLNASQECTRGPGPMTCEKCVQLETPAYVISCKAKKPPNPKCVKCGVASSCDSRCHGKAPGDEPKGGCAGVVT